MSVIESGWLKILSNSGSGNANVGVQAKSLNKGRDSRAKGVTVQTGSGTRKSATVTQSGNPAYIDIAYTVKNMGASDTSVIIEGKTNVASLNFALSNNDAGLSLPQNIAINRSGTSSFEPSSDDVESRAISNGTATPQSDYGREGEMAFRIVLQGSANGTVNSRSSVLTISGNGATVVVTIIQAAGTSVVDVEDITLERTSGAEGTLVITSNDTWTITIDD